MRTLYLIRGIPGSGKSSLANELWRSGVVDRKFEADQFFVQSDGTYVFDAIKLYEAHRRCQESTLHALLYGYSVAVSNTSTTEEEVEKYRDIAEKANAKFISLVVENRHGSDNIHNVPASSIEKMKKRFSVKL